MKFLQIPILGINFRTIPCLVSIIGSIVTITTHLVTIMVKRGAGINGSSVAVSF